MIWNYWAGVDALQATIYQNWSLVCLGQADI